MNHPLRDPGRQPGLPPGEGANLLGQGWLVLVETPNEPIGRRHALTSQQPAMARVHRADRKTMLAGDPADGGRQAGRRVAMVVAVEVGGRAPEQFPEAPELVAQGGDRRFAIARSNGMPEVSPPSRELEMESHLDPRLQ
jgi:hypothetical protein